MTAEKRIVKNIHYGGEQVSFNVPISSLLHELKIGRMAPPSDEQVLIHTALTHPMGGKSLEDLARGVKNVLIVSDDNTRPTPVWKVLPSVLGRLEASGVAPSSITILIASGTHRPMTVTEMEQKLGKNVVEKYRVVNHDFQEYANLLSLGETEGGVPIMVNRLAVEADLVIGIGNIVPHRFCGWSGGAKIVVPGICGEQTTAGTHLMVTKYSDIIMGEVENAARREMERVARVLDNLFIVNTVLNDKQEIIGVVAGDVQQAFRSGVKKANELYSAGITERAEIVIASAFPNDFNLWQAGKAFYSSDLAVKDNGIIILVSPLYEGIGEHQEFERLLSSDYSVVLDMIETGQVHDLIGAAAVLAVALVRQRASIWLVGEGITQEQADKMQFKLFPSVQLALDAALLQLGEQSKVTIIHDATEILPTLKKE